MPSDSGQAKRHPIGHALFLGLAAVVIIHALFAFYWSAHRAYTGIYVSFWSGDTLEVIAIDPGSPGDLADLRPGDQILRVGNQEIRNQADVFVFRGLTENEPYAVVYRRGASTLTGQLTPDASVFPFSALFGVILSTLFLILGLIVYLKKSWDPAARIFYLLISCLSAASLGLINIGDFINIATPIMFILPVLIPPLSLHLRLIFPERLGIIARYPPLLALIYLPFLLGALYGYFLIFKGYLLYRQGQSDLGIYHQFDLLMKLFLCLLLVYMVMGFILLARILLTSQSPEVKKQIKWIFWGDIISLVLLFAGFPLIFQNITLYSSGAHNLPYTLILATLAYLVADALAIFKYRLMDIDIVIHRSLSYLLVTGIIVLLYFFLFGTFGWIFALLAGRDTLVIYIISAMVIGFFFRPLLSWIEEGVERLFYRERYKLHQALGEVSQGLDDTRGKMGGLFSFRQGRDCVKHTFRLFQKPETT